MRNVNIGGNEYKVVASPITLFFYKKEFKSDLIGDMMSFEGMEKDPSCFDGVVLLQVAWAMIKTANLGKLPSFQEWLSKLEYVDFEDQDMMLAVLEEAREGFFRGGKQAQAAEIDKQATRGKN